MKITRSGMDCEDIKAALRKAYGPLTSISEQMGLNRNAVSTTIRDAGYSVRTEIRIAELLGKEPYEVWGDARFHRDGSPVERRVRKRPVRKVPSHLRKNGVAA